MFSGVSGLRVHQTRMDVIANNVSNVNTVGFKGSRTLFQDVFSQTISSASGASEATGRGGVNAMQIGLGAGVAAIDRMMTPGAMQRTDHAFDLTVIGSGFFIVGDESGTFFTRNGAVRMDDQSNLLYTNGMRLMGWRVAQPWDTGGSVEPGTVERGPVVPIEIETDMRTAPPDATRNINFSGNLVPDPTAGITTIFKHFHDSLGNRHSLTVEKEMVGGAWELRVMNPDPDALPADEVLGTLSLAFNVNGRLNVLGGAPADTSITLPTGAFAIPNPGAGTIIDPFTNQAEFVLPPGVIDFLLGADGAAAQFGTNGDNTLIIDFGDLTQFGNIRGNATAADMNGMPAGELTNLSVGQDGQVMALYSNGAMRALWQIPIAEFANPAGLESVGQSLFRTTANSGPFDGVGLEGIMQSGTLEMSNVDLSAEFTDMIVTQRGFQANSRIITTSDDMLQELVNLRR